MFPLDWISLAAARIAPHIRHTPLTQDSQRDWYFKWENQQVTGSFKARGALNKVLSLEAWEREQGLVTASAGNHGQGVAYAGNLTGAPVKVFASEHASSKKVNAMRELGAKVVLVPGGYEQAEAAGIRFATENGKTWVSAYNDAQVIAGQGTVGLEIASNLALDESFTVVVPTSGGGLAAGVGTALQGRSNPPKVVAVQPKASAFMHALFNGGAQSTVVESQTLADGLTGAVEGGSLTIPLMRQFIHNILLVSEESIARAVAFAWSEYGQVIEPSAAVALAAVLDKMVKPPLVVVISGGNIYSQVHAEIVEKCSG